MAISGGGDLLASPIFNELSADERQQLLSRMRVEAFDADCNIINEAQQVRGLWIIKQGHCQVVKAMPDGTARPLADLGPGAIFGEMSFFQPAPNSATVRSITKVEAWSLTPERYSELDASAPCVAQKIAFAICVVLAERLRRMDDWISGVVVEDCRDKHQEWAEFRAKLYTNWNF